MKVSMNWLKELVDVDVDIAELARLFNLHSAEVDEYYKLVEASKVVIGHVTSIEKHPNADKLSICQVDIGTGVAQQIVCGAPNVDKGQNVIVSLPGAVLPGGFKIKSSVIREIESNGMICSLSELGIDKKYHNEDGIHEIQVECTPGENALNVLALEDEVLSLDLTPNRADLMSVLGVAYDTATILNKEVKLREIKVEEVSDVNPVKIMLETDNCSAYYARVIKDIEVKESPLWMRSRLIASGVRPINNVVDITNYVMLETGQPLHAFDYDLLDSNVISVRMAKEDEILVTLDEKERKLIENDILITNGKKAVALGGVMGGFDTEIVNTSKSILLESAIFDPYLIRKTSGRLDLRSEASTRFERKVDPNRTVLALEMATELFVKYANGKALKGISSVDNSVKEEIKITLTLDKINKVLGTTHKLEIIVDVLDRLHYTYEEDNNEFTINAPTRRQDIETYQDIIEEIGRIIGYDQLPLTLPKTVSLGGLSDYQLFKRQVNSILVGQGLNEVVTYSLVNEKNVFDFTKEKSDLVHLLMPISNDRSVMSKTPLNGMIDVIKYNTARKNSDLSVFEFGKKYNPDNETVLLSGALTGELSSMLWQGKKEVVDFFSVKGILESLFNEIGTGHLEFTPTDDYPNLHPGQQAYIKDRSGVIGFIGKLHPKYAKDNNLKDVFVFEIDFDALLKVKRQFKRVKEINKFPSIYRDIALVIDQDVNASTLIEKVSKAGKRMLVNINVFDLYEGENVEEGKKSIALRLKFMDPKKTLETSEVDVRMNQILGAIKKELDATLR